jgi:hypothetical protein
MMKARSPRRPLLAGAAALGALALPATASALPVTGAIHIGKSMAGVRIGMTHAQAKAVWGTPTHCQLSRDSLRRLRGTCRYGTATAPVATYTLAKGRVAVLTDLRRAHWETERGIKVILSHRADIGHGYSQDEYKYLGNGIYRLKTKYNGHLNQTDIVVKRAGSVDDPNDKVVRITVRLGPAI